MMMRSLSTSAFGQPSDTKPTFGVRVSGTEPCAKRRTFGLAFAFILIEGFAILALLASDIQKRNRDSVAAARSTDT